MITNVPNQDAFESPLRTLTVNEQWLSFLLGIFEYWDEQNRFADTPTDLSHARQQIRQIMTFYGDLENGLIEDVRISAQGELEKKVAGSWLPAGDVDTLESVTANTLPAGSNATATYDDGVLTLGIPRGDTGAQGIQGIQGIQGEKGDKGDKGDTGASGAGALWTPPSQTERDRYCSAAWALAEMFSDNLQDVIEAIDFAETVIAENSEAILEFISGFFPPIDAAGAIVEFVNEGMLQPTIDWVRVNCRDVDAISLAAQQMYCAMCKAEDLNDFWSDINWLEGLPPFEFFYDPSEMSWDNFNEWLQFAFDQFDGGQVGWVILAHGRFITGILEEIGLKDASKSVTAAAANTAEFRKANECTACPDEEWEYTQLFLTGENNWTARDGTDAVHIMTEGWGSVVVGNNVYCVIDFLLDIATLTSITITYSMSSGGGFKQFVLGSDEHGVWGEGDTANGEDKQLIWTGNRDVVSEHFRINAWAGNEAPPIGIIRIKSIKWTGLGNNPFD